MNAKQLINSIKRVCRDNYVKPEDVTINYRYSNNDDVWCIGQIQDGWQKGFQYMAEIFVVPHHNGKGGITGQQMIDRIQRLCRKHDERPETMKVRYRWTKTSPCEPVRAVEEDLFDAESNSVLETICLLTRTGETL